MHIGFHKQKNRKGNYSSLQQIGVSKAIPCLVSLQGVTLDQYVENYSGCVVPLLLTWVPRMVQILSNIHQRRVIHRDIKPKNIILSAGELYIIDFGLAVCTTVCFLSGFGGTKDFASKNALAGGYHTCDDDFESLCFTFYYLEIGRTKWYEKIQQEGRPSMKQVIQSSKVIQCIDQQWKQCHDCKL